MKRYPEYKDSGVDWIGEIPKDWNAVPLTKYLESIIDYRGRTPEKTENGRFLVTAKNIRDGQIDYELSQEFTSEDEYQRLMTRGVPQIGDVLFTTEAPLGEVANVDDVSIALAQRIIKFRPKTDLLNPYFLKYWILSYCFQSDLQRYATGSTARGIKASKLCLLKLNLPPLKEQTKIANFLDRKTEQIDKLIRIKERKIELLQEQRTALINHAVTKGLDPNVEMKPSGVEWIGEIPKHWVVKRLKYLARLISKGTTPTTLGREIMDEGEIRFIKGENLVDSQIELEPAYFIDEETNQLLNRSKLEENDLLFVIAGTIGKVGIVRSIHLPANTNQALSFIRLNEDELPEFVFYWLQSDKIQNMVWLDVVKSAQPNLSMENLGNLYIPYPCLTEQRQIIRYIKEKSETIVNHIKQSYEQIKLLKEYRQSLITEAVTGKIDVRNEV